MFKFAVRKTEEIARRVLERNGLGPADLDLFVSHQANRRIIQAATEKLNVPAGQGHHQHRAVRQYHGRDDPAGPERRRVVGPLKKGDLVLLASVGAGFTVGAVLVRWGF